MKVFLLLVILPYCFSLPVKADCERDTEVICYWGSWSIYRQQDGFFTTENINVDICTTIVYSFAGLDVDLKLVPLDEYGDITKNGYKNFTSLKDENPCLTTMLAIGGWNEGSVKYSVVASSEERRKKFADNVLAFLVYYGFHGLDVDWEFPTTRGGISEDGKNLVLLMKEIKDRLSPYGLKLSIAVPIEEKLVGSAYLVPELAKLVDTVNLMAYDYVSSQSKVTGLSAPLSEIKKTVNQWLNAGLPSKQLIIGIPAYAKNYMLEDPSDNGIGAPVKEEGLAGQFTGEKGLLAFFEILYMYEYFGSMIETNVVDDTIYGSYNGEWFTYDNQTTIRTKTLYALENNLGGIMFWSLELDDFQGIYGTPYPLLNTIQSTITEYKTKQGKLRQ